jgi:phage shock protein PspC (stress-responsive transcriptional regulator)
MWGSLKGKKTYISCALTIIGGIAGYLTGDVNAVQLFQLVSTAIMAASVRHGIANS